VTIFTSVDCRLYPELLHLRPLHCKRGVVSKCTWIYGIDCLWSKWCWCVLCFL